MPPVHETVGTDRVVLWPATGGFDDAGQPEVGPPEELEDVRWVDKYSQVVGENGEPVAIEATVTVDRKVRVGSRVWRGALADWDPDAPGNEVMTVAVYREVPDTKGDDPKRTALLTRHGERVTPAAPMGSPRKAKGPVKGGSPRGQKGRGQGRGRRGPQAPTDGPAADRQAGQ